MTISRSYLIILLGCLAVLDRVLCGRKNELNLSKGDPSPLLFWPIQTSKHNKTNTAGKKLAVLHNVDLVTGPTTNAGTLDAMCFKGIPNSYVQIENINGILNGDNAMNWMFYLFYTNNSATVTLLEYNNGGASGFNLGIANGKFTASFSDQNDLLYNRESTFTLPVSVWTFVGVNFNKLWSDDQFDLFMIDTAGTLISETFGLGSVLVQIQALGSVILGTNHLGSQYFEGEIACLQFSNKTQIKSPQENAPELCDPNLWFDPNYGELTKDSVTTTTMPPITTTTTQAPTTTKQPPTTTTQSTTTSEMTTTTTTDVITTATDAVSYNNVSSLACDINKTLICHCFTNFTNDELYQKLYWFRTLLRVDKKTTSAALRLRTSASDNRTSAMAIGGFGVAILCSLTLGIVLTDIIDVFSYMYRSCSTRKVSSDIT